MSESRKEYFREIYKFYAFFSKIISHCGGGYEMSPYPTYATYQILSDFCKIEAVASVYGREEKNIARTSEHRAFSKLHCSVYTGMPIKWLDD